VNIAILRWSVEVRVIRDDQDKEARRARSPTLGSDHPACAHPDSTGSHRHNGERTPGSFLFFGVLFTEIRSRTPGPGNPWHLADSRLRASPVMPRKAVRPAVPIADHLGRCPGPGEPSVPGQVFSCMRRWWFSEISRGAGHR
jgi:hypothetical protein